MAATTGGGLKVGVVGGFGSHSAAAASKYFGLYNSKFEYVGASTLRELFALCKSGECDYIVVPIENSCSGTFMEVYDLLLETSASIVGESVVCQDHCLVGLPGVKLEDVKQVLTHPHIFAQCSRFLATHFDEKLARRIVSNTVSACATIRDQQLVDTAAIASLEAAQSTGLEVISASISDSKDNATRYLVISSTRSSPPPAPASHTDATLKCSIAVTIGNVPGALFKITACFGLRDVNIVKLESQPAPAQRLKHDAFQPFFMSYVFYIDFEPSSPTQASLTIKNLEEFAKVHTFGLYSVHRPKSMDDWGGPLSFL